MSLRNIKLFFTKKTSKIYIYLFYTKSEVNMRINKIEHTNFQGMYKIKNTPAIVNEIQNKVAPAYQKVSNNSIIAFIGKNPFKIALDIIAEGIAETQNSSREWLEMNAKNHGLDLSDENTGEDVLHIITGDKDIKETIEYMIDRSKKLQPGFKEKIMNFFGIKFEVNYGITRETPKHLIPLFIALSKNKEEDAAFEEFASKKIIKVNTPQELLTRMLMER